MKIIFNIGLYYKIEYKKDVDNKVADVLSHCDPIVSVCMVI
jgi:hypothetical protein